MLDAWTHKLQQALPGVQVERSIRVEPIQYTNDYYFQAHLAFPHKRHNYAMAIEVWPPEDDEGPLVVRLHDVSLPPEIQNRGVYSAGLQVMDQYRGDLNIADELRVHIPTNPEAWQRLIERHGFTMVY